MSIYDMAAAAYPGMKIIAHVVGDDQMQRSKCCQTMTIALPLQQAGQCSRLMHCFEQCSKQMENTPSSLILVLLLTRTDPDFDPYSALTQPCKRRKDALRGAGGDVGGGREVGAALLDPARRLRLLGGAEGSRAAGRARRGRQRLRRLRRLPLLAAEWRLEAREARENKSS